MNRSLWPRLAALAVASAVALACAFGPDSGQADEKRQDRQKAALPDDLKHLPADCGGFVTIRTADVTSSELGKLLLTVVSHEFTPLLRVVQESLDLSLEDVDRLTLFASPEGDEGLGGFIVRTVKPYDLDRLVGDGAEKVMVEGKTAYQRSKKDKRGGANALLYPIDKHAFAFVARGCLAPMLKAAQAKKEHPLAVGLKQAVERQIVVAVQPRQFLLDLTGARDRDRLEREKQFQKKDRGKFDEKKPSQDRGPVQKEEKEPRKRKQPDYEKLLDELTLERGATLLPYRPLFGAKWLVLSGDVGKRVSAEVEAEFADADAARDGETALRSGLYVMRTFVQGMARAKAEERMPALLKLEKPLVEALKAAKVQRDGKKLSASASVEVDAAAVEAVAKSIREAAARMNAANQFKMIGLALHNYHDATGRLPSAAICDRNGKALLSWRVAILPYLEEGALYRDFKLDEPWDSEHNKKLLARMPKIYVPTVGKTKIPHASYYRVFTGKEALFPTGTNEGMRFTGVTDGLSNTIMVVEAAEAVPWTKPDELAYDAKKPVAKLGAQFPGSFLMLLADGSVRTASTKMKEATLRGMITPAGGEVLGD